MRAVWLILLLLGTTGCARRSTDENGRTALMRAAAAGDVAAVRQHARFGADIDQAVRDHSGLRHFVAFISWMQQLPERREGWTALYFAIDSGRVDAARELIRLGADVNHEAGAQTPLTLALQRYPSSYDMVELLVRARANVNAAPVHTPLQMAVQQGDTALVRLLLAAGADANATGNARGRGDAPLMLAAQRRDAALVRQLIAAGADPDVRDARTGWTPLTWALEHDQAEIAAALQGAGADERAAADHALVNAARAGDMAALEAALAAGANPAAQDARGQSVVTLATSAGSEAAVFRLLAAGARIPPAEAAPLLYTAAFRGADSLVKLLLAAGTRPEAHHLGAAAAGGQPHVVDLLLAAGADPNGEAGQPLRDALRGGNTEAVRRLIAAGADIHFMARGEDPLGYAVRSRNPDAARVLLEAGADVARARETPLVLAAVYNADTAMVKLLLDHCADINAADGRGTTPLVAARRLYQRADVVALLTRRGARE